VCWIQQIHISCIYFPNDEPKIDAYMHITLPEQGTFSVFISVVASLSNPLKYSAHILSSIRLNIFQFGTDMSSNTTFGKQIMEQNYLNRNL
jgi:hypothetical protein